MVVKPKISPLDERIKQDLFNRFTEPGINKQKWRRLLNGVIWAILIYFTSASKRLFDFTLALAFFIIFSPFFIILVLLVKLKFVWMTRRELTGRWAIPFNNYVFQFPDNRFERLINKTGIGQIPILLNILRGEMSFVGPRAVAQNELSLRDRFARRRYNVRPGLICLWWIRRRANINYGIETESDCEYVAIHSLIGDAAIALRAIPALLYGNGVATAPDSIRLLGIRIDNLTMSETIDWVIEKLEGKESKQICFVNADCANIAYHTPKYLKVLNRSALTLADGIGMKLAGKILGRNIKQNVNGIDQFPKLCAAFESTGRGIYLRGAKPGVADAVCEWIRATYPQSKICGSHHGLYRPEDEEKILKQISDSGAEILLVAFGAPRQDIWIDKNLTKTGVNLAMGVGGLFGF